MRGAARFLVAAAAFAASLAAVGATGDTGGLLLRDAVIAADTRWEGTVTIEGTAVVKKGAALTIQPGTTVRFAWSDRDGDGIGDGELRVEGALVARGEPGREIVFTSARERPAPRDWAFVIANHAREVAIERCVFEYAFTGLQMHFTTGAVRNCLFRKNFEALRFSTADVRIERNEIVDNAFGIRYESRGSSTVVAGNLLARNDYGFFPVVRGDAGVHVAGNSVESRTYNVKMGEEQHTDLDFSGNWWGSADPAAIEAGFFDRAREPRVGRVLYRPFLERAPESVGRETAAESGIEGLAAHRGDFAPGVVVLAFAGPGPGPGDTPLARSAATDDSGRYRLALPPGSYYLLAVRSARPWPFGGSAGDLWCYYLGNPIVVEPGKMTRVGFNMVRVGLPPAPVPGEATGIEGTLTHEDRPLGQAYLTVYRDAGTNFRGMGVATVPSGADGRYRIRLPPGRYWVLARKRRGGGMYGPPGKDDFIGYHPANPIAVAAGSMTRADVELTTRVDLIEEIWFKEGAGTGWFDGVVTDAAGNPVPGLYVLFRAGGDTADPPAFVAGPTGVRGDFRVRAAVGSFRIEVRPRLGGPVEPGDWHGIGSVTNGPSSSAGPIGPIRIVVFRVPGE